MKNLCLLIFLVLSPFMLFAQQRTIEGRVNDDENTPLPGVNVLVKGSTTGTVTDVDGNYRITVNENAETLVFSYVGYQSEEITIGNQTSIIVQLLPDLEALEEIVVIGYGTQKKENLTGAVAAISGEKITEVPLLSADQALQGLAAGVTVTQPSGAPGSTPSVNIRGLGTIGNNDPLVIIDGVPGQFDMVSPNEIESISILKDAASAAIYGSRAAGGVVLITTKRGSEQGVSINYDGFVGIQKPIDMPEYLGADGYLEYYNEALTNETGTDQNFQPANPNNDTDWQNEVIKNSAVQQQHVLSLRGGTAKTKTNVSLTYQNQQGLIQNSQFERFAIRANNNFDVSDKLRFNLDVSARRDIDQEPGAGESQVFYGVLRIPPIYSGINFDGTYGEGWNGQNPIGDAQSSGERKTTSDLIFMNLGGEVDIAKGLNFAVTFSPIIENNRYKGFLRPFDYFTYDASNNLLGQGVSVDVASLDETSTQYLSMTTKALLAYEKDLGNSQVKFLAGTEYVDERTEFLNMERNGFILPDYSVFDAGDVGNTFLNGSNYESTLLSYFGRINYSYKDKYLIEVNGRYDGSSRFSKDNRWGFFPSVSAGWRLSEESFFSVPGIDDLKLRGSWGQLGNQFVRGNSLTLTNAAYYPYLSIFEINEVSVNNNEPNSAGAVTTAANESLTWETSTMSNIGFDLVLLEGKLSTTFDYFVRNTTDILLEKPISKTIGLMPAPINAGKVQNKGWELTLTHRNNIGDFGYQVTGIASNVNNEIQSLDEGTIINGIFIQQEGEEINSLYGYKTNGLLSESDLDDNGQYLGVAAKPGDIKYVDTDDDGIISDDDREVIGSTIPNFTYSLDIGANYKNFDFRIFFQGASNVNTYLTGDAAWAFNNTSGKITTWQAENRWDPASPNPDAAYPRLWQNSSSINQLNSDFWVLNASYFKMRNISVGYTFDNSPLKKIGMSKLRLYLTGQNVFNLDKIRGFDAEVAVGSGRAHPQTSIYAFGVNATF